MQHALIEKRPLLELATLWILVISERPATHHWEDQIRRIQVSTIPQHQGDCARQILGFVKVKLVPFRDIGRAEHHIKVILIDVLKSFGLEEKERLEIRLHIVKPRWQVPVKQECLS